MTRLIKGVLVALLAMCAVTAHAETVAGDKVNCRSAPRTTAPVLGVLRRGQEMSVLSTSGAWRYVDPASLPACYVRSDMLASSGIGYTGSTYRSPATSRATRSSYRRSYGSYSTPSYANANRRRASSSRSRPRSRALLDGGGSCPCGGGNICIGPRGGRYCITSGGNKRYGV